MPFGEENQGRPTTEHSKSIERLAEALPGIVCQQPLTVSAFLKYFSSEPLLFDSDHEKLGLLEDLFSTMPKKQPEMTEAIKTNYFLALLSPQKRRPR